MKYVAISHVWAHGLGNTRGNWLPQCQMQRLHNLAAALYPFTSTLSDTLIWIDTICVPRQHATDEKDYRKMAIDLLKDTYQYADKVLVLDDQVSRSTSEVTPEESLIRILSSDWMTRLWTLQEGLLSKKLRFQFQERALDAEDMLSDIMPIFHSSVWQEAYEFFSDLRFLKQLPPGRKLQRLWNYLQWRSTSHASDETICLSILTGKQPSRVLETPHAGRMKAFFEQMQGVPSDIIFMPGPRLSQRGMGWAPTSFMARYQWTAYEQFQETIIPGASDHTISNRCNISQFFPQGLRVHFPGISLLDMAHDMDMIFEVEETHLEHKMSFHVICLYDNFPPEWKDVDLKSVKHPTIILQAYPETHGSIHALFVDAYDTPGQEGNIIVDPTAKIVTPARFICRATVSFSEPLKVSDDSRHKKVLRSCKSRLLDQQWWYVG